MIIDCTCCFAFVLRAVLILERVNLIVWMVLKIRFRLWRNDLKFVKLMSGIFVSFMLASTVLAEALPAKQAKAVGVKKCLYAVEKISSYLVEDGSHGSHDKWNSKNPDQNAFSSVIERNYSDGPVLMNFSVVPAESGNCNAVLSSVIHFEKSCMAVRSDVFKEWKYKGELNREIGILESDGNMNAYLMPVKNGCVVFKHESVANIARK